MAMNVGYVRKRSFVGSEYMNLIIQPGQIAHELIPVDKRAISKIKRPYNVKKKNLQRITCTKASFPE
jgi:hypothetical protein